MSYKEPYIQQLRLDFLKYTREAFKALTKLDTPRVLELGCGFGSVSIELTKLTNGTIIGIDIDQTLLDQFDKRIKERNLKDRIMTKKMDLLKNDFPDNYFDLIWEEGVVQIIGFKQSFKACHRILKRGGYFVLGQSIKNLHSNLSLIEKYGFELKKKLEWPKSCWWNDFYKSIEKTIQEIREGKGDPNVFENISIVESELRMVKANPSDFDCAHYILQKRR